MPVQRAHRMASSSIVPNKSSVGSAWPNVLLDGRQIKIVVELEHHRWVGGGESVFDLSTNLIRASAAWKVCLPGVLFEEDGTQYEVLQKPTNIIRLAQ